MKYTKGPPDACLGWGSLAPVTGEYRWPLGPAGGGGWPGGKVTNPGPDDGGGGWGEKNTFPGLGGGGA